MAFSGALALTDLNDYLGPSQACIKPVSGKDAPTDEVKEVGSASTEIAIDADGEYYESVSSRFDNGTRSEHNDKPRARTRLETAEISLNDCLACSGCVTSAESVLIGMQSVDGLREAVGKKGTGVDEAPTHIIVSISPQSLASLSAKYSNSLAHPIPLSSILERVEHFLKTKMNVDIVMDTTFARHISLAEQAKEFQERKKKNQNQVHLDNPSEQPLLPMLASACPGWICYAEKTHGELIPLISKTRSPQQIAGILAKKYLIQGEGVRVFHTTIMPCYDKKLEASRQDFFDDITKSRDVDLVITTGELDDLMHAEGFKITSTLDMVDVDMTNTPPESLKDVTMKSSLPSLLQEPGSSSGSYLFDLIKRVWQQHIEQTNSNQSLPKLVVRTIRSADYTEYVLYTNDDRDNILFKGAQCYGFRNLQNLVRKVQRQTGLRSKKASAGSLLDGPSTLNGNRPFAIGSARGRSRGGMVRRGGRVGSSQVSSIESSPLARPVAEDEESRPYDFVEVMACPGGCVNGGGQIRPPGQTNGTGSSSALTTRTITADVTEAIVDDVQALEKFKQNEKGGLDSEGFSGGWSTPPLSISGTSEGTNGIQTENSDFNMDLDNSTEPAVQGWKGTSKEWVKRVEYIYWRASSGLQVQRGEEEEMISNPHQAQAMGIPRDHVEQQIAKTLQKSVSNSMDPSALNILVDRVITSIGNQDNRSNILRTQYRALQDEAVSGLAVQW